MSLIIFAIVVILVIAMLIWGLSYLSILPDPPKQIIMCLIVVLGALLIAQKAGLF